ncbi:hypothetical protein [Thermobifida cellulosilytica]|uniref:hypothetical protein n=1 Tax=Thermobifida cellulosilytica TaxID=144786 RepID=UPI000838D051|nr:hypothetical protein [Thermobifida cellulosilytica]
MSVLRERSHSLRPAPTGPSGDTAAVVWPLLRINLGLGYLWAFLDLTFGLGWFAPPERAWLTGNSPIRWSLISLDSPAAELFRPTAGHPLLDLALMLLLLLLCAAFTLGVALRAAAVGNALLMGLSALARFPDPPDLFVNLHLILLLLGFGLAANGSGEVWGLGRVWRQSPLVRRFPWLR